VCDNCNTNLAAANQFLPLLPNAVRLPCWSHVTNNSGEKFAVPQLDEFFLLYTALFSYSSKMRIAWKFRFGVFARAHSATRWYSMYEVLKQAYDGGWIRQLLIFLSSPECAEFADNSSVKKMLEWYQSLYLTLSIITHLVLPGCVTMPLTS
jgi:hypothetical protein